MSYIVLYKRCARAKMSLSRAKNIFMAANINSIVILMFMQKATLFFKELDVCKQSVKQYHTMLFLSLLTLVIVVSKVIKSSIAACDDEVEHLDIPYSTVSIIAMYNPMWTIIPSKYVPLPPLAL